MIAIACGNDGDLLILDSHRPSDHQIGALGVPHGWTISRRIVERVRIPQCLQGGLGPNNNAGLFSRFGPSLLVRKRRRVNPAHWKGLTRAYALCKFGSCGAHLGDAPAFAPLWVQWCSTGFIFCVTPHRFGFSQFLSLN